MPLPSLTRAETFTSSSSQQRGSHNQSDGHRAVDTGIAFAAFYKDELFFSSFGQQQLKKKRMFFHINKGAPVHDKPEQLRRPRKLLQTSEMTLPSALGVLGFPVAPGLPVIPQIKLVINQNIAIKHLWINHLWSTKSSYSSCTWLYRGLRAAPGSCKRSKKKKKGSENCCEANPLCPSAVLMLYVLTMSFLFALPRQQDGHMFGSRWKMMKTHVELQHKMCLLRLVFCLIQVLILRCGSTGKEMFTSRTHVEIQKTVLRHSHTGEVILTSISIHFCC